MSTLVVTLRRLKPRDRIVRIGSSSFDPPLVVAKKPEADKVRLVNPIKGGVERWLYRDHVSEDFGFLEVERPDPKPVVRHFDELTLIGNGGVYHTLDGKFRVWRQDDYQTLCEDPHPVRTGRHEGYMCPGGDQVHFYSRWDIWDIERNDYIGGGGPNALMTFTEAAGELAAHLAKKKGN